MKQAIYPSLIQRIFAWFIDKLVIIPIHLIGLTLYFTGGSSAEIKYSYPKVLGMIGGAFVSDSSFRNSSNEFLRIAFEYLNIYIFSYIAVSFLYRYIFEYNGTLGERIFRINVVDNNNSKLSSDKILVKGLLKALLVIGIFIMLQQIGFKVWLNLLTAYLLYFSPVVFNDKRQSIGELITGTFNSSKEKS